MVFNSDEEIGLTLNAYFPEERLAFIWERKGMDYESVKEYLCETRGIKLIRFNGVSFLKGYAGVCLEGAVIVLACIIFSLFAATPPVVDVNASAVTQVWSYIGELVFNMLVLVGAIKMSDHTVKEMMGI